MSVFSAQWHQTTGGVGSISYVGKIRVYWSSVDTSEDSKLLVAESGPEASAVLADVPIPAGSGGEGYVDLEAIAGDLQFNWAIGCPGDGELRVTVLARA